jgi:3-demethoxyubiquinol 3-hydroxylase
VLGESDPELSDIIEEYREDEAEHRQTALDHGARDAPAYRVVTVAVKSASRLAIWLSERI